MSGIWAGEDLIDPLALRCGNSQKKDARMRGICSFPACSVSHAELARVMREEIDVAVFPNRCEGGTNLVAMEALASGVPVVLANNTGQSCLIRMVGAENCYVLNKQGLVHGQGAEGWGESDVDEVVARIEEVLADALEARKRAARAASRIRECQWERSVEEALARLPPPPEAGELGMGYTW